MGPTRAHLATLGDPLRVLVHLFPPSCRVPQPHVVLICQGATIRALGPPQVLPAEQLRWRRELAAVTGARQGLGSGPGPRVAYVGTGLSCCHHSGPPPRPLTRAPRRLSAARDRRRLACPVRAVGGAAGRRAQTPFLASDIPHLGDKAARCYPPDRTQQPGPCCS